MNLRRHTLRTSVMQGPLAGVLDQTQLVYDVSGAGNNWAHGHYGYGPSYRDALSEKLRRAAEACDSLQGFMLLHSLGGGTGSGLGTYILQMLAVSVRAKHSCMPCTPMRTSSVNGSLREQLIATAGEDGPVG